ncbi:hypothetical protein DXA92_08095 [Agathobaculum butyriciproducens]|nr:hypothetical protein DXA92_08095 [Agathobaculum butyriciproducens]
MAFKTTVKKLSEKAFALDTNIIAFLETHFAKKEALFGNKSQGIQMLYCMNEQFKPIRMAPGMDFVNQAKELLFSPNIDYYITANSFCKCHPRDIGNLFGLIILLLIVICMWKVIAQAILWMPASISQKTSGNTYANLHPKFLFQTVLCILVEDCSSGGLVFHFAKNMQIVMNFFRINLLTLLNLSCSAIRNTKNLTLMKAHPVTRWAFLDCPEPIIQKSEFKHLYISLMTLFMICLQ